jgi:uncharacterized protein YndB with AHSA1/START domain
MSEKIDVQPRNDRELVLARILDAPRESVYRAWTDPKLVPLWFCPKPWSIARAEMDVRPGGSSLVVMRSPEGQEFPNPGVYLEVVPGRKIVFTDAYTRAWEPSGRPFMTAEITFEDAGPGRTRYVARAMHWNVETLKEHEKMGFHQGWGIVADQLEAVAAKL